MQDNVAFNKCNGSMWSCGDRGRCISPWFEDLGETILGDFPGLRETVHAFAHLSIYEAIADEGGKVVGADEFFGDHFDGDADVFVNFHVVVEVEILDVDAHVFAALVGGRTIPMCLDSGDVGCWGAHISGVIDEIPASGETDSVSLFFLGPNVADGLDGAIFLDLSRVGADNMIHFGEQYDFVGLVVVDNVVVLALFLSDTRWFEGCLAAGLDGCHMVGLTVLVAGIVLVVCGLGDRFVGEDMWWGFWWDAGRAYWDDWWIWTVSEASDGVSCWDHPRRWYRVIGLDDWHPWRSGLGLCCCCFLWCQCD
eukprot:scaffold11617_cov53-Attheya_sp.AAC.2